MNALKWVTGLLLGAALTIDASAYLDPGSTSYVLQIIVAAFATIGIGVKIFWKKIATFFGRKQVVEGTGDSAESTEK